MPQDCILLSVDSHQIATVSLQRAERHNAIDDTLALRLQRELQELGRDPDIRAVILAGSGINFCSGYDMAWLAQISEDAATLQRQTARVVALLQTLDTLPKPTIARVHGAAFGVGAGLVACCDVAIAASDSLFGFSEVKLGSMPATVAPYVVRAIGTRAARRYLISAERFNAGKAKSLGLIHQVVAPENLSRSVEQQVRLLLQNSPQAMAATKQLLRQIDTLGCGEQADSLGQTQLAALLSSEEGREGMQAYLQQRAPRWAR